ncbi:hypothetical protein BTUL_0085g00190 [Botrytis tulipae]|uniref:Peroxidase n=1 Tax=Botrytis tulipae TaxID=87230 RepID=A0A4Z1EN50_9HELO|nr:hypothetical protein BTUL_0085g00190 [Botrytis tulipae]
MVHRGQGLIIQETVNAYLSMSDNAALAVVAVAKCGDSSSGIKLRVGRIDAASAGPARVPGPATDLNTTLAQFAAAGFYASETISLTACEHSLGRVHNSDNPNVFNSSFVTATNLDGVEPFDSTPGYVSGDSISKRQKKCNSLSEKMIGVVPSTVTFSDTVKLMEWKAVNVMMDISLFGDGSISGLSRNLYTTTLPPKTVSYSTMSSTGNSSTGTSSDLSGTVTSIFGSTIYWPFNSTIAPGTTSLSFNNVPYPVNSKILILPAQSSFDSSSGSIIVKSATLTSASGNGNMTAVLYVSTEQKGTISLNIVQQNVTLTSFGAARAYILYPTGTKKVSSTGTVIVRATQGGDSSRIVKSTTFGS